MSECFCGGLGFLQSLTKATEIGSIIESMRALISWKENMCIYRWGCILRWGAGLSHALDVLEKLQGESKA